MNGYSISTNLADMDIAVIHGCISNSYWAKGIPISVLEKAISNSLCFGVFTDSGQQVGFARLITDSATFAYLADVFILEAHRGKGLSKWLMENVIAHPDLQGLRRITLSTKDAHGLYEKYGFKPLANPQTFMEAWKPDVYQNA
ncbi:MAG: GNAT family N-acetyltransferase [Zetaproteobacteria bacterium CG2_30_46_52]|nr:MAG: GNAT family N-acetyltransferase [Zetaproteobacteria bacterium CG2_30_46_52]